jgi:hypothetical protein
MFVLEKVKNKTDDFREGNKNPATQRTTVVLGIAGPSLDRCSS